MGGINTNVLGQGGFLNGATSQVYDSCNQLNTNPIGGFAGNTNWRVPTIAELESLIDKTVFNPSINTSFFPDTVAFFYWSSSSRVNDPAGSWIVYFLTGAVDSRFKSDSYYVRCVRGL
jgi:hypothetical protein